MKQITIIAIFLVFLFSSCSTIKYREIDKIRNNYNSSNETNYIALSNRMFNPTKKIFNKLDNSLGENYIYIFSWVNHLPMVSDHFTALLYDVESNETFYINNTLESPNDIKITKKTESHKEEMFILNYYLDNKIDSLTSLPLLYSSAEMGTQYSILDISVSKAYVIENLFLNEKGQILKFSDLK